MATALTILLTAVSTAVVYYVTSSLALAQKQLIAATRLSAYLAYWQNWFLENELFGLYYQGMQWNQEMQEILKRHGGVQEIGKLQEEKKKLLGEMQEKLKKHFAEYGADKIISEIRRAPKEAIAALLDSFKVSRENLIRAQTFVSDDEAACLGTSFGHSSVQLKMNIVDLLDTATLFFVLTLSRPGDFDEEYSAKTIAEILWKAILISKDIDLLARSSRVIANKSVLSLTMQNIRKGTRFTKR